MDRLFAILMGLTFISGCGTPCNDPTRINGDWLVRTALNTPIESMIGINIEGHPIEDASILAPTMPWSTLFRGSTQQVELKIGPDKHFAEYTKDPEDCDAFQLTVNSLYQVKELDEGGLVSSGTEHDFLYEAKLRYTGPRITGTFRYQDEWASLVDDDIGSLTVQKADFVATQFE